MVAVAVVGVVNFCFLANMFSLVSFFCEELKSKNFPKRSRECLFHMWLNSINILQNYKIFSVPANRNVETQLPIFVEKKLSVR